MPEPVVEQRVIDSEREHTDEERAYDARSRRIYTVFAPFYDAVMRPLERLRREVARVLDIERGARVLDVATGTGAQARALAERAREVVGIDLSEPMLRIARRKSRAPNVTFRQADARALPFDDASFDVACISFALHEMPRAVRGRVVREMVRVTKPGGTIAVVDYGLPRNALARWLARRIVGLYESDTYSDFVRSDLGAFLRDAGVDIEKTHPALGGVVVISVGRRAA